MDSKPPAQGVKPPPSDMGQAMRTDGTRLFRMMNWELFAKPTPRMRMFSMAGSGLFVGIIAYFTFFADRPQPQPQLQQRRKQ